MDHRIYQETIVAKNFWHGIYQCSVLFKAEIGSNLLYFRRASYLAVNPPQSNIHI